ncbi:MAG: dihydropteroate synthase [Mucinivorans sp.]
MITTLNIGGHLVDLGHPVVMTIMNLTTDSFYAQSRLSSSEQIIKAATEAAAAGATILDLGGYSTRPGAVDVPAKVEIERLSQAIGLIRKQLPDMPLSVDTFRSEVIQKIVQRWGAVIVNDVSGGTMDPQMMGTVGQLGLPYICGHIKGTPQTMASHAVYKELIEELLTFFVERMEMAQRCSIKDFVVDPCFGFAKNVDHNFELLRRFGELSVLGKPLLAGLSRKSFLYRSLNIEPQEALVATSVAHLKALEGGAQILRVHDTVAAMQTITLFRKIYNQ